MTTTAGVCQVCGCTDDDCSECVERTGGPCSWVEPSLCSACVGDPRAAATTTGRLLRALYSCPYGVARRGLAGQPNVKRIVRKLVGLGLVRQIRTAGPAEDRLEITAFGRTLFALPPTPPSSPTRRPA